MCQIVRSSTAFPHWAPGTIEAGSIMSAGRFENSSLRKPTRPRGKDFKNTKVLKF